MASRSFAWHQDKSIYFALFGKLLSANVQPLALSLLKTHFAMFMPFEKLVAYLEDAQLYDDSLHGFFTHALVDCDRVAKELKVLRGFTQQQALLTREELVRMKVTTRVVVAEDTLCDVCCKEVGLQSFCFEYATRRVMHQYCHSSSDI